MSNKNYIYTYIYTFYYYLYTFFPPLKFISLFKIAQIDVAPTFLIFQKIWRPLFKLNLKKSSSSLLSLSLSQFLRSSKWIAPLFFPIQTSRLLAWILRLHALSANSEKDRDVYQFASLSPPLSLPSNLIFESAPSCNGASKEILDTLRFGMLEDNFCVHRSSSNFVARFIFHASLKQG